MLDTDPSAPTWYSMCEPFSLANADDRSAGTPGALIFARVTLSETRVAVPPASVGFLGYWASSESANRMGTAPTRGSFCVARSTEPEPLIPGFAAESRSTRGSAPSLPKVNAAGLPFVAALSASPGLKIPFGGGRGSFAVA